MHNSQTTDSASTNPASNGSAYTALKVVVCLTILLLIIGGILWNAESE